MTVLAVEGVAKRYGANVAVDDVSLAVAPGEFLALVGPSGCGKTTLLRIMAGLAQPDSGRVIIGGADMSRTPPHARPVNMMFQSYALFPHMTVAENVAFGLRQEGLAGPALRDRVGEALALVALEDLAARRPHQLSGGQQQRVALARCIAKRPQVLLLDEPLAALDKALRERTQLELMALRRRLGIAFVFVTHDQSEAMAMATRIAVMNRGRILQIDKPRALYDRPASRAVAQFLGEINLWEGTSAPDGIVCAALGQTLALRADMAPGTAVAIAVRPERITFAAGQVAVDGRVEDVIYRGAASTVLVRADSGAVVRVASAADVPPIGARVTLGWAPEDMLVLP